MLWARIGEFVGQRNLIVTANVYTHVMLDEGELNYAALLAGPDRRGAHRGGHRCASLASLTYMGRMVEPYRHQRSTRHGP